MSLFDLITKIYFSKKLILKNFLLLITFNIIGLIFVFGSQSTNITKTLIFRDVPINAKSLIFQDYGIRKLVENGLIIAIEIDQFGFQIWDHKFISRGEDISESTIDSISNVLFKAIIDHKVHIESTSNKDPIQKNKLNNIKDYIQLNKIKKYSIIEDENNIMNSQRIISILMQANIFAIIVIFIFRIRLFSKNL